LRFIATYLNFLICADNSTLCYHWLKHQNRFQKGGNCRFCSPNSCLSLMNIPLAPTYFGTIPGYKCAGALIRLWVILTLQ
jgi:hypothetical protein